MSRNCRRFTNEKIRGEIAAYLQTVPVGEDFPVDHVTEHIQALHPKANINNKRIGLVLGSIKEEERIERAGHLWMPSDVGRGVSVTMWRKVPA